MSHFRTDRYFNVHNKGWYFDTKEGLVQGPYESKHVATIKCKLYILKKTYTNRM